MKSTKKTLVTKAVKAKPKKILVKQDKAVEVPIVVKKKSRLSHSKKDQSVEAAPQSTHEEGELASHQPKVSTSVTKAPADGRIYATGRRKTSVARVWIKRGGGSFTVNGQHHSQYFKIPIHLFLVNKPFIVTDTQAVYSVMCTVAGGGSSGQAGAVAHGISRAIAKIDEELRPMLSKAGLLTRDKRKVERKKPGHKKARRSFQFSKR
jgi:small subunit ribosomal protein S9